MLIVDCRLALCLCGGNLLKCWWFDGGREDWLMNLRLSLRRAVVPIFGDWASFISIGVFMLAHNFIELEQARVVDEVEHLLSRLLNVHISLLHCSIGASVHDLPA